MIKKTEDIDDILGGAPENKDKASAGKIKVFNHTHFPRTIDTGPASADAPGERLVLKVPKGEFDNSTRQIVPGATVVSADLWQRVQKHPVGAKLISKGIISGIVQ